MIFETHAHYDDEAFDQDREELLSGMEQNGIGRIVNIAADLESCQTTLELGLTYPFVYAALGVHPSGTAQLNEENFAALVSLVRDNSLSRGGKVVAVGEVGLDYYWEDNPDREIQKKWFARQIEMAKEAELPLVIHSREAARDTYELMRERRAFEAGGIIHCYAYSRQMAAEYLSMGFLFGIGGVVTFKNSRKLREVVEYLPIESMVLETDSPYLAPVPNRGKRNSSLNLPYIAQEIAKIKGMEPRQVIEITEQNAYRVFKIPQ